jgi:putative restriction endonuclease
MNQRVIDDERALRFALWGDLQADDGPDSVLPRTLLLLRVYGGARGIWVDKVRTRDMSDDGAGITVALLHTGAFYDDDLSDDGVIYHYPSTETSGWDEAQVAATKNAARMRVPVFVISRSALHRDLRKVRLGWVEEWDDHAGQFLVVFGDDPPLARQVPVDEAPFLAIEPTEKRARTTAQRMGQARFRFDVLRRYDPTCSLCEIRVLDVLDTPHVVPVADRGSNDPRNGLVMCATHHRAFDAHLVGIEPETLDVRFTAAGPDARSLRVAVGSLAGLGKTPHPEALSWRWDYWREHARV